MKAMILAAGKGTRLLPLTEKLPKPMIPISSEPLIVHQLRWLKRGGITDVVINLHHLGDQIRDYLGSGKQFGVKISYSEEEELLDTGGGIVKALPMLGEDEFVVLNGDIWTGFRFQRDIVEPSATIHLVLVPCPKSRSQGDFGLNECWVTRDTNSAENPWVYSGIAFVKPQVLFNQSVRPFSLRDVLFEEVSQNRVSGEIFDGIWFDIGTHEGLKQVRRLML